LVKMRHLEANKDRGRPPQSIRGAQRRECRVMPFSRVAWIVTVLVAAITAVLLVLAGYVGYGALSVAVGISAAINLL
jgi:hypothetical protein